MYFGWCYNPFFNPMLKESALDIKLFIFFSHCTAVKWLNLTNKAYYMMIFRNVSINASFRIIRALWELAYNIALWICMHYCNVHPSQDLRGRMVQIKHTVSATFIRGHFGNFYVNRLLSVEKMCGMKKEEGMQTTCSWLESWGQRLFKVITFTILGQHSFPHDVNGNILKDWESGWGNLFRTEMDFTLINKFLIKYTDSMLNFISWGFLKNKVDGAWPSSNLL